MVFDMISSLWSGASIGKKALIVFGIFCAAILAASGSKEQTVIVEKNGKTERYKIIKQ